MPNPLATSQRNGLLIAFEGIDGSGKSTQMDLLAKRLTQLGLKVHCTAEPTKGPMGGLIRDAFNHRNDFSDEVIAGLFVADRLHHITDKAEGLLTLLRQGYIILTDRYYMSSYAYQGVHVPMDWVIAANAYAVSLCPADIHIYIDVPPGISTERLKGSRQDIEKYETLENLKAVHHQYSLAIDHLKKHEQVAIFSGELSKSELRDKIWDCIKNMVIQ